MVYRMFAYSQVFELIGGVLVQGPAAKRQRLEDPKALFWKKYPAALSDVGGESHTRTLSSGFTTPFPGRLSGIVVRFAVKTGYGFIECPDVKAIRLHT